MVYASKPQYISRVRREYYNNVCIAEVCLSVSEVCLFLKGGSSYYSIGVFVFHLNVYKLYF